MRNKLLILAFILIMSRLSAAEFDPAACPDLSAKIFHINARQAVLYVSANSYTQKGMGFDKFELRNYFYRNEQKVNLTLEMTKNNKPRLKLAIPLKMDKNMPPVFLLSTRKSGLFEKINKTWSWNAEKAHKGILVFKSYTDSDCQKVLRILKIDMADNNAVLSSHPGKKFKVSWRSNNLTLEGLSSQNKNTFIMDFYVRQITGDQTVPRGEYFNTDSCVTVLEYTVDYWCGLRIFPITEKFYLTGLE